MLMLRPALLLAGLGLVDAHAAHISRRCRGMLSTVARGQKGFGDSKCEHRCRTWFESNQNLLVDRAQVSSCGRAVHNRHAAGRAVPVTAQGRVAGAWLAVGARARSLRTSFVLNKKAAMF